MSINGDKGDVMGRRLGSMTTATLLAVAVLGVSSVACSKVASIKAMKVFKDANRAYQAQDYKKAASLYEETVAADPNLVQVYFFLGNSYDNLYRPGLQDNPANDELINKAVQNYQLAAERLTTATPEDAKLKKLAMEYLVAAYGPDKLNDPAKAEPIIQNVIRLDPTDPLNYFQLAKLYEDAGIYDEAERVLTLAREAKPKDAIVYMQLASYYNRQGEFDKTIKALEERAAFEPNNPEAFYTIATYYWDKTYRDFRLKDTEKRDYIGKGLTAINRAIEIKSDYVEALVYKNLLLRLEANNEKDPAKQQALIKEADVLRDKAEVLRKEKAAATTSGD